MRPLAFLFVLLTPGALFAAGDYVSEYERGRRLQGSDPAEASEAFMNSMGLAVDVGDVNYANAAGVNAVWILYGSRKSGDTAILAKEIIGALAPLGKRQLRIADRVQLFGYMESGYHAAGQLGEARRANRAAADTLRGKFLTAADDGSPVTVDEVIGLPAGLRGFGWRLLMREADLLDLSGRTIEALELLDEAEGFLGDDWTEQLAPGEQFYAFKLLAARITLLDFLGYKEKGLAAQRDLLLQNPKDPQTRKSRLIARINHLRDLSQWEGPSQEIVDEARKVATAIGGGKKNSGADLLVAKMEFDLEKDKVAAETMEKSRDDMKLFGDDIHATYAERDGLFARGQLGEDGLDSRYFELLSKVRSHGNKRGEPTVYENYGRYLLRQNRHGEAIAMFAEALRLTRSFSWKLHEPALVDLLIYARCESGDLVGAKDTLQELVGWILRNPDAPAQRIALAHAVHASGLARLGDASAARAAFELARQTGAGLPKYQQASYTETEEKAFFDSPLEEPEEVVAKTMEVKSPRIEPMEVFSVAEPGNASRTRFSVFNPNPKGIEGAIQVEGPGAEVSDGGMSVRFTAGGERAAISIPARIPSCEERIIKVITAPSGGVDSSEISIAWGTTGLANNGTAAWQVNWSGAGNGRIVLDASGLESNPFRSIRISHELAVPVGELVGIPFRIRSPAELRFEYYDSSGRLVGVDANGNGDFTEAGDLYAGSVGGVSSAVFPIEPGEAKVTAEVLVFSPDGKPLPFLNSSLALEVEVRKGGEWIKEAEDILR